MDCATCWHWTYHVQVAIKQFCLEVCCLVFMHIYRYTGVQMFTTFWANQASMMLEEGPEVPTPTPTAMPTAMPTGTPITVPPATTEAASG